jgi:hypothetical protein
MLATTHRPQAEPTAFRRVWWSLALCAMLTVGALAGAHVAVHHATGHAGTPALVAP